MKVDRRPLKNGASSNRQSASSKSPSSRRQPPPERRSGRNQPAGDDDAEAQASMFRKIMFFGTGVLVVLCIVLVVVKWGAITQPPPKPQKKVVIDENKDVEAIKDLEGKAARMFADAKRVKGDVERNKAIRAAMDVLSEAMAKCEKMSENPKYKGEEFDAVFGPLLDRMTQEMKTFRDAIKVGAGR